ncbi:hypothetical protein Vadar_031266 [Vaccinium darrowii]|uniref:Uncharacterized protein n=1 Tax=Vaccinium darrowii TaxID=229202 RepID=A0ACB7YBL3_9ERIC|nr:hypothetical protein Vadar_031266 [Vaccinium darrowii]
MALVVTKDRAKGNFAQSLVTLTWKLGQRLNQYIWMMKLPSKTSPKKKNDGKQSACSSGTSSQPRSQHKRGRDTCDEESDIKTISNKLGQVADAITRLTWDKLNVQALHDEVMKMEDFDEAFLVEHERLGKAFMAKSINLRRIWL